jgi:NAD(P)H-nitrite reductase large subunit
VVAPEKPMAHIFGSQLAELIAAAHRDQGVDRHVGRKVDQVNEGALRLDDGTLLDADLVVVGIGVAPRFGLAQAAGIAVDGGRDLSTAVPDIFAARTSLAGLIATAADAFALSTG